VTNLTSLASDFYYFYYFLLFLFLQIAFPAYQQIAASKRKRMVLMKEGKNFQLISLCQQADYVTIFS
jgi:hypothetical protein